MKITKLTRDTQRTFKLAREKHWGFRVVHVGEMPDNHFFAGDWLFIPVDMSDSTIPQKAIERVKDVVGAGVKIDGVIIAHEAPKLLTAPVQEKVSNPRAELGTVLQPLFEVVRAVLAAAGYMLLLFPLLLVDPAVIIVVDGVFIEVYRWYE